jgi:hypothetical protein
MASSEFTKPRAKMSSSGWRSWFLKNFDRNSLILDWFWSMVRSLSQSEAL